MLLYRPWLKTASLSLSVITLPLYAPRCACFLLTLLLSVIPVLVDADVAYYYYYYSRGC